MKETMPEITPEQALEEGNGLIFEKVWIAMMEDRKRLRKIERLIADVSQKHTEVAELQKETGREIKETAQIVAELSRKVDRVCGNVGGLNRSMGELIESLFAARLWEKFPQYGLKRAYQRIPIYNEKTSGKPRLTFCSSTRICVWRLQ